jgi:hypothetical protein
MKRTTPPLPPVTVHYVDIDMDWDTAASYCETTIAQRVGKSCVLAELTSPTVFGSAVTAVQALGSTCKLKCE